MSFFGLYQRYSHSILFKVLARNLRKSTKEIVFPKIVHINTAQANTLPLGAKFQYVVLWNIPNKQLQHAVQRNNTNYSKVGERKWAPLRCLHRTLPEQIRDQQPPYSTTSLYFIFQRNTTIVLLNSYNELI